MYGNATNSNGFSRTYRKLFSFTYRINLLFSLITSIPQVLRQNVITATYAIEKHHLRYTDHSSVKNPNILISTLQQQSVFAIVYRCKATEKQLTKFVYIINNIAAGREYGPHSFESYRSNSCDISANKLKKKWPILMMVVVVIRNVRVDDLPPAQIQIRVFIKNQKDDPSPR